MILKRMEMNAGRLPKHTLPEATAHVPQITHPTVVRIESTRA